MSMGKSALQRFASAGQPRQAAPAPRAFTKIDTDAVRTAVDRLVDRLDQLGFNVPAQEIRGRTTVAHALQRLNETSDLKILDMWLKELEGELVTEMNGGDSNAKVAIVAVQNACADIRDAIS